MSRVKIKEKAVKDPELIELFNNMLGEGTPDPSIVIPKYESIMKNSREIIQLLESFLRSPLHDVFVNDFVKGFSEVRSFIKTASDQIEAMTLEKNDKILTGEDLNEINSHPERMKEYMENIQLQYKISNLGEAYKKLKGSELVKEMVMTLRNLNNSLMLEKDRVKAPMHGLEDKDKLSPDFIINCDGDFLELFSFSTLDFKQIYLNEQMNPEFSKYLLFLLHLLHKKVGAIVKDVTTPDIDVDKFAEVLIRNIAEVRKHIPRCDKAFDKIANSVDMLKQNFGEYYKDFISSQNPGIIIENFVSDVAQTSKADIATTNQFRRIIQFYRKSMSGKVKNPKIKKLFEIVSSQLTALETDIKADTPDQPLEAAEPDELNDVLEGLEFEE